MDTLFAWIETSALSTWLRESTSMLAFPAMLSAYAIGMGLVVGINAAIALRIFGCAPQIPLVEFRRFLPVVRVGFWLNALSGVALLVAYPTKALTNPVFYAKLIFIALGLTLLTRIARRVLVVADRETDGGRALAAASMVCWAGAIFTGRFLAYTYLRLMSS